MHTGRLPVQAYGAYRPEEPVGQAYDAPGYPLNGQKWACSRCTFLNNAYRVSCEQCGTQRNGGNFDCVQTQEVVQGHVVSAPQPSQVQTAYAQSSYMQPSYLQPGYGVTPSYQAGYDGYGHQQGYNGGGGGGMSTGMAAAGAGVAGLAAGFIAAEAIDDIF